VRMRLCDVAGASVGSSAVTVTAVVVDGSLPVPINPLAGQRTFACDGVGYVYRLDTTGLAPGNHVLYFQPSGDPAAHGVSFLLR